MTTTAAHIAQRLAGCAESVCQHYLSNGRRSGRYWLVGDVYNSRGSSLFVRLTGPMNGRGAAGRWTDAATGQHGDLLDLIQLSLDLPTLGAAMNEARSFLGDVPTPAVQSTIPARDNSEAARRLFRSALRVAGTLGETYLRTRAITCPCLANALRFHPNCYYRADDDAPRETWPALIAAVTDLDGEITGVHRTYLARDGSAKAPLEDPRRSLGNLYGNAVRFGRATDILVAGEGLETMLSLRSLMPTLPVAAALSSAHLSALILPPGLSRLYIAVDNDAAGRRAAEALSGRASSAGVETLLLTPSQDDWNTALHRDGHHRSLALLRAQIATQDADTLLPRVSLASNT